MSKNTKSNNREIDDYIELPGTKKIEYVSVGSRYNRKMKDEEVSSATKQQQFDFGDQLDSFDNLDISFVENKRKYVKKNMPSVYQNICDEKKNNKILNFCLMVSILISVLLFGFIVYHFTSFNHKKVEVDVKTIKNIVIDDNYLFLGDSITDFYDLEKFYPDMPVVNSGISGNTTQDILDDMENRVYRYNPSKVFIVIGINDLSRRKSVDEIVDNIKEIVNKIQENRPYCKIYLESVYPVNTTENDKINMSTVTENRKNEDIKKINEELKKFSKEEKITYIDMFNLLKDEDDNLKLEYTTEGLHISEKGYEVITKEIMKYLKK